jgi:hypothetical protein
VPELVDLWPYAGSFRQFLASMARAPEGAAAGW